jgi:hypothetical protein
VKPLADRALYDLGNFKKPSRAGKVRAEERTFTPCKAVVYTNAPETRNLTAQQVLRSSIFQFKASTPSSSPAQPPQQ